MQCSQCSRFTGWWCPLLCHTHCHLTVHAVFTVHGVVVSAALSHTLSSDCRTHCHLTVHAVFIVFTGWWCPLLCHTHCHLTVHAVFTVHGVVVSAALSHTLSSDCRTHCHLTVHAVFTVFIVFTGWWCPLLCHTHCHLTVHAVFTVFTGWWCPLLCRPHSNTKSVGQSTACLRSWEVPHVLLVHITPQRLTITDTPSPVPVQYHDVDTSVNSYCRQLTRPL